MRRVHIAAIAGAAVALAPAAADAHFVLQQPASWAEQDPQGQPQKTAPCGQADPQVAAVPTGAVTAFQAGQTITVSVDEVTFHPGHYRVVLSTTGQGGLPADPETTLPGTCMALDVQDPPVYPVLADGMLPHTDPFVGPQSFQVTLPRDVTCTGCTLQVLEFMQADVGGSGNCFYHHCANISIAPADAADAGVEGGGGGGCACALGEHRASRGLTFLALVVFFIVAVRRPRALRLVPLVGVLGGGACGDDGATAGFAVSPGDVEHAWLDHVGSGPAQTAVACARGAADPVARALCASPSPAVGGLSDLYRVLGLAPAAGRDRMAVTTHSLGLAARTVSALNPRVVVFPRYSPLDEQRIAAVAFSRGEPFVEMVGYDAAANDFNFYLLAFQPGCADGCTPADLMTERLEGGWTGWTLYADHDLEDTPLDCTSCHRPDGAGARRRLLMRQVDGPWMHWGDFRGVTPPTTCTDAAGATTVVDGTIAADGADLLRQIDGADGRHGGVAVADLIAAQSGYDLSSFLYYAAGLADGSGDIPCQPPDCPFSEPAPFPSEQILCDRLLTGRADGAGGAWDLYRAAARAQGLPAPYFDPDVVDPSVRAVVAVDFPAFVTAGDDAFTRLSSVINSDTARAIGFVPDETQPADAILRTMCARCHDDHTDKQLARSRFNAVALDRLDAAGAAEIVRRISLPRTSPDRMPPLRAGELPDQAIARIADFLGSTKR